MEDWLPWTWPCAGTDPLHVCEDTAVPAAPALRHPAWTPGPPIYTRQCSTQKFQKHTDCGRGLAVGQLALVGLLALGLVGWRNGLRTHAQNAVNKQPETWRDPWPRWPAMGRVALPPHGSACNSTRGRCCSLRCRRGGGCKTGRCLVPLLEPTWLQHIAAIMATSLKQASTAMWRHASTKAGV